MGMIDSLEIVETSSRDGEKKLTYLVANNPSCQSSLDLGPAEMPESVVSLEPNAREAKNTSIFPLLARVEKRGR
jgi:hypothetical protein